MTQYYPSQNRRSLIENCLLNAYIEAWEEKATETRAAIDSNDSKVTVAPFAYESFILGKCKQSFKTLDNDIFTDASLLFKNMYDASADSMETRVFSDTGNIRITPKAMRFESNAFDTMTIENKMSYIDAVKFIHSLYLSSPDIIYGVLLHNGTEFINPLHPLIAQSMTKTMDSTNARLLSDSYKVMIYTYKPKEHLEPIRYDILHDTSFDATFTTHILKCLGLLEFKNETTEIVTSYSSLDDLNNHNRQHDIHRYKSFRYETHVTNVEKASVDELIFQPVQIINSGIASPYYGFAAERYNGQTTRGYHLSPMLSCNINFPESTIKKNGDVSVSATSVCTGNYANSSDAGRLSLNHANLGSPYFRDVLTHGSFAFAKICVRISLGIYAEFFDLQRIDIALPSKPVIPISFVAYRAKHPNASLKDYLASIKI
jgi:hypothetical protein